MNKNFSDEIKPSILQTRFKNLESALSVMGVNTAPFSRTDEITDNLPREEMSFILFEELGHLFLTVKICFGAYFYPTLEDRKEKLVKCHTRLFGSDRGVVTTYKRMREKYYWKEMRNDVDDFIQICKICQEQKLVYTKTREPMVVTDTSSEIFYKVGIDTLGLFP